MKTNTKLVVIAMLTIVSTAPAAHAEPDPAGPGADASTEPIHPLCVDVDIWNTPPVAVYECYGNPAEGPG
jgi:hypothetical protein